MAASAFKRNVFLRIGLLIIQMTVFVAFFITKYVLYRHDRNVFRTHKKNTSFNINDSLVSLVTVNLFTAIDIPFLVKKYSLYPFFAFPNAKIRSFKLTRLANGNQLPDCEPEELGEVKVPLSKRDQSDLSQLINPYLFRGGVYTPDDCITKDHLAVLVPYRNRRDNLAVFLPHLHNFLQLQKQSYGIYIIEQFDKPAQRFNRGKLLNIGFTLTRIMFNYTCYLLHDIDKVPQDSRFLYKCGDRPMHLPFLYEHGRSHLLHPGHMYPQYFGGVSSIRAEHYAQVNGMVNNFWGWGAEDDDLYSRLNLSGLKPVLSENSYAQFYLLKHKKDADYSKRKAPTRRQVKWRMSQNGLNSLKFKLIDIKYKIDHTLILVEL